MMEIDDWEKRAENTPLKVHMIGNFIYLIFSWMFSRIN